MLGLQNIGPLVTLQFYNLGFLLPVERRGKPPGPGHWRPFLVCPKALSQDSQRWNSYYA